MRAGLNGYGRRPSSEAKVKRLSYQVIDAI
jgi:hypothetical protein